MLVYFLLIVTLLLAFVSILLARKANAPGTASTIYRVSLALSVATFIYLYGAWVFISVYARYVFAACFMGTLLFSFATKSTARRYNPFKLIAGGISIIVFSILSILYFTGTTGKPYGVANLAVPFKKGTYYVFQGGKGLPTNLFHYELRGAVYAMYIVKLNRFGNRANGIFSKRLKDYEIYNDTLYAPCDGRVMRFENCNQDNIPPDRKRGPTNTNYILLQNESMYVFMAHLRPGCVFVHKGDFVKAGQPIACCGNSGFSLEPHLHIQAHARTNSGLPWYREKPLMITFNDRFYRLFEEIEAR